VANTTRVEVRVLRLWSLLREGLAMKFANSVKKFLVSEDGPTAVEYAVMMALIIVVCITTITAIGNNANTKFTAVKNALT
jgi:pilus assembly protein Flp/PilA